MSPIQTLSYYMARYCTFFSLLIHIVKYLFTGDDDECTISHFIFVNSVQVIFNGNTHFC